MSNPVIQTTNPSHHHQKGVQTLHSLHLEVAQGNIGGKCRFACCDCPGKPEAETIEGLMLATVPADNQQTNTISLSSEELKKTTGCKQKNVTG